MIPKADITMATVRHFKQFAWFRSWETNASGNILIWCNEGEKIHPWPFLNIKELTRWAKDRE